jgi:hypothetical protein
VDDADETKNEFEDYSVFHFISFVIAVGVGVGVKTGILGVGS